MQETICQPALDPQKQSCSSTNGSSQAEDSGTFPQHSNLQHTLQASGFTCDDPLIPELLSWISCAAILGGLAGSAAVASCCKAIRQASGCSPFPSLQQIDSDAEDTAFDDSIAMHEQSTQAGQALEKARSKSP